MPDENRALTQGLAKALEAGPDRHQCPKCRAVMTIAEMNVLGFEACGYPDCGVEITEMKRP